MTEHERRIHDKTIKAYERDDLADVNETSGVPRIGQNLTAIQQKYINKAFGDGGSPMMQNAKRPNLNEVVNVAAPNPYAAIETGPMYPGGGARGSLSSLGVASQGSVAGNEPHQLKSRQPSQLAMAGSLNILSTKSSGAQALGQKADEDRLKKVMQNMEKEKSLQFR